MADWLSNFEASDKQPSARPGPHEEAASLSGHYPSSPAGAHWQGYSGHNWSEASSSSTPGTGTYGMQQLDQDEYSSGFQDWDLWYPSYGVLPPPEQSPYEFAGGFPPASTDWSGWDPATSTPAPTPEDAHGPDNESETASTPSPEATVVTPVAASQRQEESRRGSSKMHQCVLCGKEFPRPSGLRTHMNTHNEEQPYTCEFPGCERRFNVLSNARRHYRTHGVGHPPPSPSSSSRRGSHSSSSSSASGRSQGYEVNFDAPMTPPMPTPSVPTGSPFRVRWIEPNSAIRGAGWGLRQTEQDVDPGAGAPPVPESG
ncbi:hypothetical protein C8F01DRAFT_696724 [Mycena amicta]|nr:hypothetical protein C8F01DRAFT_696724 [Mycena amicta]